MRKDLSLATTGSTLTTTSAVPTRSKGTKRARDVLVGVEEDPRQARVIRFKAYEPKLEAPLLASQVQQLELARMGAPIPSMTTPTSPAAVADDNVVATSGPSSLREEIAAVSESNSDDNRCLLPSLDGSANLCEAKFVGIEKATKAEINEFSEHLKQHVNRVKFHKGCPGPEKPGNTVRVPCGRCFGKDTGLKIQFQSLHRHLKKHFRLQSWVCPNCGEVLSRDDAATRDRHKCDLRKVEIYQASKQKQA